MLEVRLDRVRMPSQPVAWIASCGGDTVKLWDLEKKFWSLGADGCHVATLAYQPTSGRKVLCARWNHTNYVVASGGEDPRISMWTAQGQRLGTIPEGGVEKVEEKINIICFSRRSRLMITAGSSHAIRVWDMRRRVCTQSLTGHTSPITCVAVNAKDEQLASVDERGTLCLHNLNSWARVAQLWDPEGQALDVVEYSPHVKHFLATAGDRGAVHLWNTTSRKIERSWKVHTAPVSGLSFSPTDPKVLVTVGLDKRLLLIDPTSKSPPLKISAEVPLTCVHFNDDGTTAAVGTIDGRILFFDVTTRAWKRQAALQAYKKSVQVTCVQWQSFAHSESEDATETPARPQEVTFQPEVDLKAMPSNLRGSDKVMASLFTPRDKTSSLPGANGGSHTPSQGIPSEMDVFSPLVDVQPITPFVPKNWEDRPNTVPSSNHAGIGVSRLSFTEVASRLEDHSPSQSLLGEASRRGSENGSPAASESGKERFSMGSDLRLEAKLKLQASISAKGRISGANLQRPGSSGSSRSGSLDHEPASESSYLTRHPPFDQLPQSSTLPPRYSHLPSSLENAPSDRSKLGSFTSSMYSSARLLAEAQKLPVSDFLKHRPEDRDSESPKPNAQHDATPSTFGSPIPAYDSGAHGRFSSDGSGRPSEGDVISPDWLTSKAGSASVQVLEQEHLLRRLESLQSAHALESDSGRHDFAAPQGPASTDSPAASHSRRASSFQLPSGRDSPRSQEPPDKAGIGRRQDFGHGKDVRWHENAIVQTNTDSRPPSEPPSIAPTPHAQPFSLQLVVRALEDSLGPLQRSFHQEIQNLHLELLRQFHMQQVETQTLVGSILERQAALEDEVRALRKENQQLKHLF